MTKFSSTMQSNS